MIKQNRDISKKLLEITSKIDLLGKKNEELKSHVSVAQNASKMLQEGFKTTCSKLVESLDNIINWKSVRGGNPWTSHSGIPNSVAPKDLENFILRLLQEIGINLDKHVLLLVI